MAKVIVLQHIEIETIGIIADCLKEAGHQFEYVRLFEGQPLPKSLDDLSALIIMGGPMGVYDVDRYSFLSDEIRFIEKAIRNNMPVLGVCLGSQLIAAALGSRKM